MTVTLARSLDDALTALADDPGAHVLAGGTDFMVEVNFGHRRPASVVSLAGVDELRGWREEGDDIVLGAGLTYAEMLALTDVPGLANAARTVGSPQIRNAGTLGGNLATASPAGDALPVLAALDAVVVLASATGRRELAWDDFLVGPKRTARRPDEVIVEVRVPALRGPQHYLKVGVRNAMVIAVASLALVVDLDARTVRCALGSVGPTPLRATDAERYLAGAVDWDGGRIDDPRTIPAFADLVAGAARPIDDHRSTAEYRRHAVGVLAARALQRSFPA